jgi:hypothetical protein
MPEHMPEDMPATKRINVMVGITRSKVIIYIYIIFHCMCIFNHAYNYLFSSFYLGIQPFKLSMKPHGF